MDRRGHRRSERLFLGHAICNIMDCSESVSRWMSFNRLKLNPLKTELIRLHSSRRNPTFLRKTLCYQLVVLALLGMLFVTWG